MYVDLHKFYDANHDSHQALVIVDFASNLTVVVGLEDESAQTTAAAFAKYWVRWAGIPEKIVNDRGTHFRGAFQQFAEAHGVTMHVVPPEAHWQVGLVERTNQVMDDIVSAVVEATGAAGRDEMEFVYCFGCQAKNRRPGRHGYSSRSYAFGLEERLPNSVLSHRLERPDDVALSLSVEDLGFRRANAIREASYKAVLALDYSSKYKAAVGAQPEGKAHERGQEGFCAGVQVFCWKHAKSPRTLKARGRRQASRWHGPGVLIGREWVESHECHAWWVSLNGDLTLCPEQPLRLATWEERLADSKVFEALKESGRQLRETPRTDLHYEDLMQQTGPPADPESNESAPVTTDQPSSRSRRSC